MDTTALLAGAIGSLLTVVATKLLEVLQTSQNHRFSLQKATFQRQLRVAEQAASRFLRLDSTVSDWLVFCEIQADEEAADDEYMIGLRESIDRARKYMTQLEHSTYPFWLYFDVDEYTTFPDALLRRYHKANLDVIAAYRAWEHLESAEAGVTTRENLTAKEILAATQRLKESYRQQAEVLRDVRVRYRSAIDIVKRQLRTA